MRFLTLAALALLLASVAHSQTVQTLYSFPANASAGKWPAATLTVGPGGDLYGTATEGGAAGNGAAFKITTAGAFTSLGSFDTATTGRFPYARLVSMPDGFLYGATEKNGGTAGDPAGTVFKLDPAGGLSVVFQLPGSGAGPQLPRSLVATDATTLQVLGASPGGLWQVATSGGGTNTYTFGATATDGVFPYSITRGSDGKLYGTTHGVSFVGTDPGLRGTLFRIEANGTGMTKLHDCVQATGTTPRGAMVQATDGNFYGTMGAGGTNGKGVVFRLTPAGSYSVIHHFSTLATPQGDLIQATDGLLYGTTRSGGPSNMGGVFRVSLSGAFTVLHQFTGANGSIPLGGLAQAADGNLYGTTYEGGAADRGTIFRVTLNLPPANRAPVALDDVAVSTGSAVVIDVLGNDFDPERGALTVTSVSTPTAGTAEILADGTVRYTPGGAFSGTDTFTYTVADPLGLSSSATVAIQATAPDGLVFSGTFNGLLNLDPELTGNSDTPRAQIFLNVNRVGGFTGVLLTQRQRLPFRGAFNLNDGTALVRLIVPVKGRVLLFLGFRSDERATILAAGFGREVWSGAMRPMRQSGLATTERFTVVLDGSTAPGLPAGHGYGVMTISPAGAVSCVGRYGDGTPLSWGTTLVADTDDAALIPVFSEPVAGAVCAGVFDARIDPNFEFAASLRWVRAASRPITLPYAAGFAGATTAAISQFVPQATLANILDLGGDGTGTASIDKGRLNTPINATFSYSGIKVTPARPLASMLINRSNGLVTGRMMVGTVAVSFVGVVNQPNNFVLGQFSIGGRTGQFQITP